MKKYVVICIATIVFYAQDAVEFTNLFNLRQATALSDARAKSMVTYNRGIDAIFYNTSGLTAVDGLSVIYNHSSKYYLIDDVTFTTFAAAYKLTDDISVGASFFQFRLNDQISIDEISSSYYWYDYNASLAFGYQVNPSFSLGFKTNYFVTNIQNNDDSSIYFDLSAMFQLDINNNDIVKFGLNTTNLTQSAVTLRSLSIDLNEEEYDAEIPSIINLGTSYIKSLDNYSIEFSTQYDMLLNGGEFNAIRFASTVGYKNTIFVHTGYFSETIDGADFNEFTYGLSLNYEAIDKLNLSFDFTHLPQPKAKGVTFDFDDYTSIAFGFSYNL
jgi:hypothetical protein